ncbi:MAG TPA: hypothetical protein VFU13_16560 [Steroidobacteraceae bacterium]|nr:hypothetical protein [Steroidobacteraceae bacterium]
MSSDALMPQSAEAPSNRQRLFVRYFTAILIDLVVLNLFVEYSGKVFVDTFTISLLAAILLQVLLKLTIVCEHWVMDWFKARGGGGWMTFLKYFVAWLILFGSKFVILEALVQVFGDKVRFEGRFHGIITLIVVVVVMLVAEELIVRLYRKLGSKGEDEA